jgi:hypothetical protein
MMRSVLTRPDDLALFGIASQKDSDESRPL